MLAPGVRFGVLARFLLACFLLATFHSASAGALGHDVFVDPSRTSGCPGTGAQGDPYCGWADVRQFTGGNRYLQKAGTTFRGTLRIAASSSVSADRPITIGAYDAGLRPRIRIENPLPGALKPENWRSAGGSVWAYSTAGFATGNPAVLLLDGRRALGMALKAEDLCVRKGTQRVEWFHDRDVLLLCSLRGNPATVFRTISGMQVQKDEPSAPVLIQDQHHVVIDGLALEGGRWGALEIRGQSSHIEVRNCVIGLDSASGIHAQNLQTPIRNLDIHDNVIDSGVRWGVVAYAAAVSGEGVHFNGGVQDSRVHGNRFVAWPHNGLYLDAHLKGSPGVSGNLIDGNEFHCGPASSYFDYCRPFGVDGFGPDAASRNVFFNNTLHDFSVATQVNGNDNFFVGNRCYGTVNSKARSFPTGQCFSLQPYLWSRNNLIANNTMVNTADVAVQFRAGTGGVSTGHRVVSNIMYGCGLATIARRRGACIAVDAHESVGPQALVGNLLHNPGRPVYALYREEWPREFGTLRVSRGDTLEGNRLADPYFRDLAGNDFSLQPDSPALGAGLSYPVPGLRFAGPTVDIGAVQSPDGTGCGLDRGPMNVNAHPGPLRLLLITPSLSFGGAERQLVQLMRNLDKTRYAVVLATFAGAEQATSGGFYDEVRSLGHVRLVVLPRRGRWNLVGPLVGLVKLIRRERIQVIHSFLNLASTFGLVASRLTGVPIVASAIRDSKDPGWVYRWCRILQAYGTDFLVANSEAGFDNRFGRRRSNFRVIGNGLDMARFTPRPDVAARLHDDLALGRFTQLVGMVATLSDFKDHPAYLEVAARVVAERPQTGFLVIGDGPQRGALEALSAQLGLGNNVVFAGYQRNVDTLTGMLDVACLFTNYRIISEGLPNAVMEAMACGVPVVATDDGGTREILHHDVEGYLVARNDVATSARLIIDLLDNDGLRRSMGQRGRAAMEAGFAMDVCVKKYEGLYQALLSTASSRN